MMCIIASQGNMSRFLLVFATGCELQLRPESMMCLLYKSHILCKSHAVYTSASRFVSIRSMTQNRPYRDKVRVYVLLARLYVPPSSTVCSRAFIVYLSWLWHRPVNRLSHLQHCSRHCVVSSSVRREIMRYLLPHLDSSRPLARSKTCPPTYSCHDRLCFKHDQKANHTKSAV